MHVTREIVWEVASTVNHTTRGEHTCLASSVQGAGAMRSPSVILSGVCHCAKTPRHCLSLQEWVSTRRRIFFLEEGHFQLSNSHSPKTW